MAKRRRSSKSYALFDFNSISFYLALLFVLLVSMFLVSRLVGVNILGSSSNSNANLSSCATIPGGTIVDSAGNPVTTGYDKWGYNYQAHMFNGYYGNFSRPAVPVTSGDKLVMQWSDEWLSNKDCDGDHKLDRGLVNGVVNGVSMGWLTNHMDGTYEDLNGTQHYTDFVKIVWVGPGGDLWGQYHIIQEVYNDSGSGNYRFKDGAPGFGLNDQWTQM